MRRCLHTLIKLGYVSTEGRTYSRVMGIGPLPGVRKLLERLKMSIHDFDVIELNEAFAAQGLALTRELGLADDSSQVNRQWRRYRPRSPAGCQRRTPGTDCAASAGEDKWGV